MTTNPSLRSGWSTALQSPRLVLAVWIVPFILSIPFILSVQAVLVPVLGPLPERPAPGDLQLIVTGAMARSGAAVAIPLLLGVLGILAWTILWHAGLVRWRVWASGRPQRLGEVVGHGLSGWWRYARLAAGSLAAAGIVMAAVWVPASSLAHRAAEELAEARSMGIVAAATLLSLLLLAALWAGTLRALWELGRPDRRSAVLALARGVGGTVRHPVASVGVLLAWAIPMILLWAGSLAAVMAMGTLGSGVAGVAVIQLAALLRAVCQVGLVGSFAPVVGLAPRLASATATRRAAPSGGGDEHPRPGASRSASHAGTHRDTPGLGGDGSEPGGSS